MSETPLIAAALDDRYIIEREIGSGGMAIVYLARDKKLDREVALKVLRPELGAVLGADRFLAEIKISARLDHPHILTLIDSGESEGFLYYVLPYVRGESLRDKLNREHQLSIDEALTITKQVASALDYAHRQGLVHRDIKPENILIQEGEAMLTDFGIALAVKEAGGNRLTQTGLSLGTPQYMSPEQATGDRGIDARSDVYSLAAVLYEMLAGEPPVTGASAQSMIAKLMTETPTHLRVLRNTITQELDAAVARALAKTPADRFTNAGDFARAIDVKNTTSAEAGAQPNRRRPAMLAAAMIAAVAASFSAVSAYRGKHVTHATLGDRTQLTSTGEVLFPAISSDGKQLAYLTRVCKSGSCTLSTVVQDVGGTTTRTILEGATAGYGLEWSPDRRNLILTGTVDGHAGTFLLSALGGSPRALGGYTATFFAGGDSLLIGPSQHPDSVFYVRVAALDGVTRDSIRIPGPGEALATLSVVPGTNWILSLIVQAPHGLWQMSDRAGKVVDHLVNACTCGGMATYDAVWLARAGDGNGESVVRVAIDRANGHFAAQQDTMAHGAFTQFTLTTDGTNMVMDQGTYDQNAWALPFGDAVKGNFPDSRRVAHASSAVSAAISPDGRTVLFRRVMTTGDKSEARFSVMPYEGGNETPIQAPGARLVTWMDSSTVAFISNAPKGSHLAQVDIHSGAQRNALDIPDSTVSDMRALSDGWAWINAAGSKVIVQTGASHHEYPILPWFANVWKLNVDAPRHQAVLLGFGGKTGDTAGVATLDLATGKQTILATRFAEDAWAFPAAAHVALMGVAESQNSITLYTIDGPGEIRPVGKIGRPARTFSSDYNMDRIAVNARDYHADAWLNKVIRQ